MIYSGNAVFKPDAEKVACCRHKSLKSAEPKTDGGNLFLGDFRHSKSFTDGNGKSIHGKSDCQDEKFCKSHIKNSLGIINLKNNSTKNTVFQEKGTGVLGREIKQIHRIDIFVW